MTARTSSPVTDPIHEAPERVLRARDALEQALEVAPAVDLAAADVPPARDGWAAAPDLLRLLAALVETVQPRHVLEFGSGLSTLVLARAVENGECVLTSVDHDPRFVAETARLLHDRGQRAVALQLAPLVARVRGGRLGPAYLVDQAAFASARPADLIVVDGPPSVLGGRRCMLPQALEHAQCGSLVLFDDADRLGEREALTEWEELLGDALEVHRPGGFVRGLAAVILAAPEKARMRRSAFGT